MARQANQKLKMLYLLEILRRETDEEHPLSLKQIIDLLAQKGISAERILIAVVENVPVPLRLS